MKEMSKHFHFNSVFNNHPFLEHLLLDKINTLNYIFVLTSGRVPFLITVSQCVIILN